MTRLLLAAAAAAVRLAALNPDVALLAVHTLLSHP